MSIQRVLFVCMGNICRSPLAEGVFLHKAKARGVSDLFEVDSAGTGGWHAGDLADARMRETASRHGVDLPSRARQVRDTDYAHYDSIICMDLENRRTLLAMGAPAGDVQLLLDFAPDLDEREVPDPYYGGDEGFEHVYQLVDVACDALLDEWGS